jgi:photosystem II stability/assembly factor-like uncharacterized protein
VYCGTFGNGLFRSCDGGATWRSCAGLTEDKIMSLAIRRISDQESPDVIYAGTEPSKILRSNDGVETWRELSSFSNLPSACEWSFPPRPETHHVRFILPDPHRSGRIYAAIEAGALLRSDDAGETWRDVREILTPSHRTRTRRTDYIRPRETVTSRVGTAVTAGAGSMTVCSTAMVGASRSAALTRTRLC